MRLPSLIRLLLALHPPLAAAQEAVPMHQEPRHRLVRETPTVRIMDVQIPPGDTTLFHRHQFATVYLDLSRSPTDVQLEGGQWAGNPRTAPTRRLVGSVTVDSSYVSDPFTHRVANIGTSLFRLIAVSVRDNAPVRHQGTLPGRIEVTSSWFRQSRVRLGPGRATAAQTAPSPILLVLPTGCQVELAENGEGVSLAKGPGAWRLIEAGSRYRLRNPCRTRATAVLIQLP